MFVDFTHEQKQLQSELRGYLGALVGEKLHQELAGGEGGGSEFRRMRGDFS